MLFATAMKRLLFARLSIPLALPLVACYGGERRNTGECPAGETCSDQTPRGLDFIGNRLAGELLLSGPRPTAIGGTQAIALEYDRGDGVDVALDLPFTADDDGGLGVKVESALGSQVTVRGHGSRSNYLRILDEDGLLMDRKELTGAALDQIKLVSVDFESIPDGNPLAFAPGPRTIGVALYGDVQKSGGPQSERLIDTSMDLQLSGAERTAWDALELNATLGTHLLSVTAGDKPTAQLDVVVVSGADTLAAIAPPSSIPEMGTSTICFQATSGGRYIVGLDWMYNVDGEVTEKGEGSLQRNCVTVSTQKTSGTVSIQASAGGQTTAMALTVSSTPRVGASSAEHAPVRDTRALSHAVPTAGDRSAGQ